MGMLTMRYLLAFYSGTTSQWRCLDTDLLPQKIERPEDIPMVLEGAPQIALSWMLERRSFGTFQGVGDGDATVLVYALDLAGRSPFGNGTDYIGPWLEMFMQAHEPIGSITLAAEKPVRENVGFNALQELATAPLQASDEACQQTMDRMRDHADLATERVDIVPKAKRQVTA